LDEVGSDRDRTSSVRTTGTRAGAGAVAIQRAAADRFTTQNLAFQKKFPLDVLPNLGLPGETLRVDGIKFYGQTFFLQAAIF
jgi:hypothetical protein